MATEARLNLLQVPAEDLHPNPWNTNSVSPENELKLEESLKRFGVFKPILCRRLEDDSLEILGGEHRWRTALKLGYTTVPVIDLGKLSDKRAKEIGLADNGRYGDDDPLALSKLLKDLGSPGDLMSFLPYTDADLSAIFGAEELTLEDLAPPKDEDLPAIDGVPKVQTHTILRFKVPIEDADFIERLIGKTMKSQKFTEEDSLSNAGNALIHLLRSL